MHKHKLLQGDRVPDQPCIQALLVVRWIPWSVQSKNMGPIAKWLKLLKLWSTEGRGEFTFLPTKKTPLQVHFYVGTMIEPPPSWRCVAMAVLEGQISEKKTTCRPGKPSGPFAEALCLWQGFSAFTCAQTHPHSQKVMSWVEQGFTLPPAGESGDTIPEIDWHPRSLSSTTKLPSPSLEIRCTYGRFTKTMNFFHEQQISSPDVPGADNDLRPKPSDWSSLNRLRFFDVLEGFLKPNEDEKMMKSTILYNKKLPFF